MSRILSGNNGHAKLVHRLDSEDVNDVGPGAWTLKNGATIEADNARFGNNLKCDTGSKLMDSDSAVSGFDDSDGKKVLYHLFWFATNLSFNRTMAGIVNATQSINRTRIIWDVAAGGRIITRWTRKTNLAGPSTGHMRVRSKSGLLSTGQSFSLVGFLDSGSTGNGKIFIDGIDQTLDVANTSELPATAGTFQHARLGNHINGLDPGQFTDEVTIVQDDGLDDAKAERLVDQYDETQGFGYFITYGSQSPAEAGPDQIFTIFGTGFGKDVTVTIGAKAVQDFTRIDQGQLRMKLPAGLGPGLQTVVITNVESGVILTITDEFTIGEPDDEQLRLILRGERNGTAHPVCEFRVIDDAGDEIILEGEVKRKEIVLRRDDRRTALARFVPPIQSLDVTLKNDQKQFTRGFGGAFDGLLIQGQVVKPFMGFFVDGIKDLKPFGKFRIDDVQFNNSPPAEAQIQCRDLLSAALDQEISFRSFTGLASDYIIEILAKVGIITEGSEKEIDIPVTTTSFTATPIVTKTRALDILSEVLAVLQAEANYRLIQDVDGIIKLVVVPSTGFSDQSFHWLKDLAAPYSQKERANQSTLRTTVVKVEPPTVTEDVNLFEASLTEADFTGSPPQKVISISKAIRIYWRTPEDLTQAFEVKEVSRTPTALTLEMVNPIDTGTINVLVRGDTTSDIVGESGSGEDQSGAGFGNEIDRQKRRRGRSREIQVRFVANDTEAQDVSDTLQIRFGDPASEQDFGAIFGPVRTKLNDLVRIIEKFSESRDLHSVSQISLLYEGGGPPGDGDSFTGNIIAVDAGIQEPVPNYDLAFIYDRGLIYDDRFKIGDKASEDQSFRGAVVADL